MQSTIGFRDHSPDGDVVCAEGIEKRAAGVNPGLPSRPVFI
ncbi:hypothetical protein [Chloracidobacterium thermophilum]|nr:hypothetical protein [Chloracidobacterium thermophilum]